MARVNTHGPSERNFIGPTSAAIITYMVQNWRFLIFCHSL